MATANLGLSQPARGAEVGTWDTPVNANSGLLDTAFGGSVSVALTNSNVTLSAAQYQNVFLTFTGTITANIAITFPAVGRFYTAMNLTSNTSAFYLTANTTVAGSQSIGIPPGETVDIFTDGSNVKFRNFGRIGSYWDYAGSSVPAWNSICTVPPYLNCDATTFSSATYPVLATILGTVTLPDSPGRLRATLNQGSGRITTAGGGVDGNTRFTAGGSQSHTNSSAEMFPHSHIYNDPQSLTLGAGVASGGNTASVNATTTVGSGAAYSIMNPVYIGGITLIRAG